MIDNIERDSSFDNADWFIYQMYGAKHNKEPLQVLQYEMTVPDLLKHREYLDMMEDMESASEKDYELRNKHKG